MRSGVQHLADKLDFVDGKVDPDSVPDSPVPASDQPDDIIKQISHILSRSGNSFVYYTIFFSKNRLFFSRLTDRESLCPINDR